MTIKFQNLVREDIDAAASMLARAFENDPLMKTFFSDAPIPEDVARQELFRFSCLVRYELGWPLVGLVEDGRICGAACISFPERPEWPALLDHAYEELKSRLGTMSVKRLETYGRLVDDHRPDQSHHFLAVLGVDPRNQGRGLGRLLLEDVQRRAAIHPTSVGVALDTENPKNLPFYQYFGYELTAESTLNSTKIWHFFRSNRGISSEVHNG
jgi:GNAT superfamily N-acetyltransferase